MHGILAWLEISVVPKVGEADGGGGGGGGGGLGALEEALAVKEGKKRARRRMVPSTLRGTQVYTVEYPKVPQSALLLRWRSGDWGVPLDLHRRRGYCGPSGPRGSASQSNGLKGRLGAETKS